MVFTQKIGKKGILYSEVVKDIKGVKLFCKANKIKPFALVILWVEEEEGEREYIYAYDKKLKRRTAHFLREGYAISVISGSKFKYNPREINAIRKAVNKLRSLHR